MKKIKIFDKNRSLECSTDGWLTDGYIALSPKECLRTFGTNSKEKIAKFHGMALGSRVFDSEQILRIDTWVTDYTYRITKTKRKLDSGDVIIKFVCDSAMSAQSVAWFNQKYITQFKIPITELYGNGNIYSLFVDDPVDPDVAVMTVRVKDGE